MGNGRVAGGLAVLWNGRRSSKTESEVDISESGAA
jgi:hypothetical protein